MAEARVDTRELADKVRIGRADLSSLVSDALIIGPSISLRAVMYTRYGVMLLRGVQISNISITIEVDSKRSLLHQTQSRGHRHPVVALQHFIFIRSVRRTRRMLILFYMPWFRDILDHLHVQLLWPKYKILRGSLAYRCS